MPLTFIDIERQKNWRITLFFLVLMVLYLAVVALFSAALPGPLIVESRFWIFLVVASFLAAGIHFWFSAANAVDTVVRRLDAQPPDPKDDIHRMFANIIQELHVVSGNKRDIRCAVIPSLSLNALAAADLKGNAVIAVTEGLLSRLTRPQIEAVVAHEAHHILSGDCLETTVAASIFGTFSSAMEKIRYTSSNRLFASPAFLLAWVLLQLGYLLNLFISREREYRADAAAVRMTRNPLALAETLHFLSRGWRGAGFIGSGFEMLCIVNPMATALDETEGFLPDLLSTHPPLRKRMDLLLAMARVSVAELDSNVERRSGEKQADSAPNYFAMSPRQQWQGPFTGGELDVLPWLSPLTWVATGEGQSAERAWKDPLINAIFLRRLAGETRTDSGFTCPSCRQPLATAAYKGTQVFQCSFCAGMLVENGKIPRIIARTGRERPCTERLNALARSVLQQNQTRNIYRKVSAHGAGPVPLLPCPKCKNPMYRGFYSTAHLIEVDRCSFCGLTWFDQDELEMLQCMIENRLLPEVPLTV
ncbi:MAG: zinc metalloprotease HtpX [Nitrospirota bacterium]